MRESLKFSVKPAHPYAWLWEPLEGDSSFELRTMFGAKAVYLRGKLQLCFSHGEEPWRGVLVCTEKPHHSSLVEVLPSLSPHPVLPKWLYLPESAETFESAATRLVSLVRNRDGRIGVMPKPRKPKTSGPKPKMPRTADAGERPVRLKKPLAISRIILFVRDIDAVAAFYQRHFGLRALDCSEDGWLEMSAGTCNLALHRATTSSRERGRSPAKIVFAVADVHAAKERFAANGLKFGKVHEVKDFAFANARDPEGNPIQISSRGIS